MFCPLPLDVTAIDYRSVPRSTLQRDLELRFQIRDRQSPGSVTARVVSATLRRYCRRETVLSI